MGIPNGIPRGSRIALSRRLTDGVTNDPRLTVKRQRQARRVQRVGLDDDADDSCPWVQDAQTVLQYMRCPHIALLVLRDFDCFRWRVRLGIVYDLLGSGIDACNRRARRACEPQRGAAVVVGRFGSHDERLGDAEREREFFDFFCLAVEAADFVGEELEEPDAVV